MIICMHASSVFASATCLSEKVCHSETIDVPTSNHRVNTQYTERSTHGLVHRGDCCGQYAPQYSRGHIGLLSVLFLYFFRAGFANLIGPKTCQYIGGERNILLKLKQRSRLADMNVLLLSNHLEQSLHCSWQL